MTEKMAADQIQLDEFMGTHLRALLELCWEIEKPAASKQQTKVSVMASEIYQEAKNWTSP